MPVILDTRTELGYKKKAKAENIKSFGDILGHILQAYKKDKVGSSPE